MFVPGDSQLGLAETVSKVSRLKSKQQPSRRGALVLQELPDYELQDRPDAAVCREGGPKWTGTRRELGNSFFADAACRNTNELRAPRKNFDCQWKCSLIMPSTYFCNVVPNVPDKYFLALRPRNLKFHKIFLTMLYDSQQSIAMLSGSSSLRWSPPSSFHQCLGDPSVPRPSEWSFETAERN